MGVKNPDLLFDDVLTERADRVAERVINGEEHTLDRVTLFLTHRCNLFCEYCNGPHMDTDMDPEKRMQMLSSDMDLPLYSSLLEDWGSKELKHLHFTGGEATMNPLLPEFTSMATERGIACTITTNGMASLSTYGSLIKNGMSEFRVSIDSLDQSEFDTIVKKRGAHVKLRKTVTYLIAERDKGADISVVFNACIGVFNIDRVRETLEGLMELNPDAIKFLVIAEERKNVQGYASRKAVDDLIDFVRSTGRKDELLEQKIKSMFRKDTAGLHCMTAQKTMEHCFIPLTERTLDAEGIYPCSIYLRYKGKPLASADASFEEQQAAIREFVENYDCRTDEICTDHCTNCCKVYNIEMNLRIRQSKEDAAFKERPLIKIPFISDEEIEEFIRIYNEIPFKGKEWFAIIKPQGMPAKDEIIKYMQHQGVGILDQQETPSWTGFSRFLYGHGVVDPLKRIARNKAFAAIEDNQALFLRLSDAPAEKYSRLKTEIRRWFGEERHCFSYDSVIKTIHVNAIHFPDYRDLERENGVVHYFLGK